MTDHNLLSRYGVSPSQLRPGTGPSRPPSSPTGALIRPASKGPLRPASSMGSLFPRTPTKSCSQSAPSSPTFAAPIATPTNGHRPLSAPEAGAERVGPPRSWSFAAGDWLSVGQLVNVTQSRRPSKQREEELVEDASLQLPRFGTQLRRPRRRQLEGRKDFKSKHKNLRQKEAAPSETSLWADAQGSSSESESDSEAPVEVHKSLRFEGEGTMLVGCSVVATADAQHRERERRRHQNAFVEYEDREQRLQRERRWLQEDPAYFAERRQDLRSNTVQRSLDIRDADNHRLFENAVLYNDYAHCIHIAAQLKEEMRRHRTDLGPLRELALPKIQRLKLAMQQRHKDASEREPRHKQKETSADVNRILGLQRKLLKSHDEVERAMEPPQPRTRLSEEIEMLDGALKKTLKKA